MTAPINPIQSNAVAIRIETKFICLNTPVAIGSYFGDCRVTWLESCIGICFLIGRWSYVSSSVLNADSYFGALTKPWGLSARLGMPKPAVTRWTVVPLPGPTSTDFSLPVHNTAKRLIHF